jgi:ribonuclease P protein component
MTAVGQSRFPRQLRLTAGDDFRRVYQRGRKWRGAHFTAFFEPNQTSQSRFGLTVSRKLGSAVRRNRIKRIFREALRGLQGEALSGFDFVFNPYSSAGTLTSLGLAKDLERMFSQLKEQYNASIGSERN